MLAGMKKLGSGEDGAGNIVLPVGAVPVMPVVMVGAGKWERAAPMVRAVGLAEREAIAMLFLHLLGRDQSETPKVKIVVRNGTTWPTEIAIVYVGETAPELAEHYRRVRLVDGALTKPGETAWKSAEGATEESAVKALLHLLIEALRLRTQSDLDAWERATGTPWPGTRSALRPVDPHVEPDELEFRSRRLPR